MTQLQNSILLIDDEPQIRKFLRISLNAQGYRVLEAGSGTGSRPLDHRGGALGGVRDQVGGRQGQSDAHHLIEAADPDRLPRERPTSVVDAATPEDPCGSPGRRAVFRRGQPRSAVKVIFDSSTNVSRSTVNTPRSAMAWS